jgi:hypothetical protein
MTAFDSFRRRAQRALFASLPDHIDRLDWDRARILTEQRERCRALLAVAKEQSPFHAGRLRGLDPGTFELDDLVRLPVMTKAEMMDAFDDVVTDHRLNRAIVEHAVAATTTEPVPIAGDHVVLTTGGSTGAAASSCSIRSPSPPSAPSSCGAPWLAPQRRRVDGRRVFAAPWWRRRHRSTPPAPHRASSPAARWSSCPSR